MRKTVAGCLNIFNGIDVETLGLGLDGSAEPLSIEQVIPEGVHLYASQDVDRINEVVRLLQNVHPFTAHLTPF